MCIGAAAEEEVVSGFFCCPAGWAAGVVYSLESVKVAIQWEVSDAELCDDAGGFA
jgi:hypothetical protein